MRQHLLGQRHFLHRRIPNRVKKTEELRKEQAEVLKVECKADVLSARCGAEIQAAPAFIQILTLFRAGRQCNLWLILNAVTRQLSPIIITISSLAAQISKDHTLPLQPSLPNNLPSSLPFDITSTTKMPPIPTDKSYSLLSPCSSYSVQNRTALIILSGKSRITRSSAHCFAPPHTSLDYTYCNRNILPQFHNTIYFLHFQSWDFM